MPVVRLNADSSRYVCLIGKDETSASRKLTPNSTIIQVGASKPFRVISGVGEMLILPPSLANDIRNNEKLSFAGYMKEVCDLLCAPM
jgi:hypothetical protein